MKLVCGIGINDADYNVVQFRNGKQVWICPHYRAWKSMLGRVTGVYTDVTVVNAWKTFSNFRLWSVKNAPRSMEGYVLDKDLLSFSKKVYGPLTCVYIPKTLNSLLTVVKVNKNGLPLGVSKMDDLFVSQISYLGKKKGLGRFLNPSHAHRAWQQEKVNNLLDYSTKYYKELDFNPVVYDAILTIAMKIHKEEVSGLETVNLFTNNIIY